MSLGLLSGFAGSLVGLAGGFVAVPFLTGYFGLVQNIAHGTSMAVVFATSLGASFAYAQKLDINDESPATSEVFHDIPLIGSVPVIVGNVHVLNAACVALTSSMSIIAGAVLSKRLPAAHLKLAMGCAFMIVGPMIPFQKHFRSASRPSEASKLQVAGKLHGLYHKHETVLKPLMIGLFSGLWAGILGVGGGVIIVPALCFFTDMDYKMALATSLACEQLFFACIEHNTPHHSVIINVSLSLLCTTLAAIFPTSIVGAITQFRQGQLIPRIGAPLAVGCLIG